MDQLTQLYIHTRMWIYMQGCGYTYKDVDIYAWMWIDKHIADTYIYVDYLCCVWVFHTSCKVVVTFVLSPWPAIL
jgi:hypothetical protein